jgi:hypothetical protein
MATSIASFKITWEPLPDDFILPDDPVDNINQPALASALTDSLQNAGKLPPNSLTPTNYGICATVNDKIVIKAPDWAFIPEIRVPRTDIQRSYTPQLQGDIPLLVVEFLSDTEGGEYSIKSTYPPGKWFFYQTILRVKHYVIFEPQQGILEVYGLNENGETCSIVVEDFKPFFYVMVSDKWNTYTKDCFLNFIKTKMGKYYEKSITECIIIKRRKLYGFDGGKEHKFIKFEFNSMAGFNKAKKSSLVNVFKISLEASLSYTGSS